MAGCLYSENTLAVRSKESFSGSSVVCGPNVFFCVCLKPISRYCRNADNSTITLSAFLQSSFIVASFVPTYLSCLSPTNITCCINVVVYHNFGPLISPATPMLRLAAIAASLSCCGRGRLCCITSLGELTYLVLTSLLLLRLLPLLSL